MIRARSGNPIRFGVFELDIQTAELRRKGVKLKLQHQPFEILLLLLERPGELITREQIRHRLWPAQSLVEFEHSVNTAMMKLRRALGEAAASPTYIETLPGQGYRFIAPISNISRAITSFHSLAVLPLDNLSREPQDEHFVDGMTEELITRLAQIRPLRVISRSSVMQYKNARLALTKIAAELNVQVVVEGSVLRDGERIRITAQLIDAVNDQHLWAAQYDRDLRDILTLQTEIASQIAECVSATIVQRGREQATVRSIDPEAYDHFLKGNYFFNQLSPNAIRKAKEYYLRCIGNEPDWAPAYAKLAETYRLLNIVEVLPAREAYALDKAAAERALRLDFELPEAHAALGAIKVRQEWNWAEGHKEFQLALNLNPNSVDARVSYSSSLVQVGRTDDALSQLNVALSSDPYSVVVRSMMGWSFYLAGRYDDALEQLRGVLDMDCNFSHAQFNCGLVCMQKQMLGEALNCFREACRLTGRQPRMLAGLGHLYGHLGQTSEAQKVVEELLVLATDRYVAPTSFALALVTQDRPAETMEWLRKAIEERDPFLPILLRYPALNTLHRDGHLKKLIRQMRSGGTTGPSDQEEG
jgi:TolB-like protein/Tfp pilus assembly protein PilF